MKPRNKYERQIIAWVRNLTDQFRVERTRSGHIKVIFEGSRKASVVFCGSQSDYRSMKNSYSDARHAAVLAGVDLKET